MLVLAGFLIQWPTILTLAMFPVLVVMYVRLAKQEEKETKAAFGEAFDQYAARVPAFLPRWARIKKAVSGTT
jgi:protein-S-isoprenylcysteine O-methyltransferase Ste14